MKHKQREIYIISYKDNDVYNGLLQICQLARERHKDSKAPGLEDFMNFHYALERTIKNNVKSGDTYRIALTGDQVGEIWDRLDIHDDELYEETIKLIKEALCEDICVKIDDTGTVKMIWRD